MANTPKSDINDEHTEWRWFSANEIPEDISPPIKPVIEQFKCFISKLNVSKDA